MTDTQIDILKTATDWAKAEMFSSGFFVLFGLAFCLSSYCFWQFGKTDTAKAYVIPLLVAGAPLLIIGVGLIISNQMRLAAFPDAFNTDAAGFVASEIARADKTVSGYANVFRTIPIIIIVCAGLFLILKAPLWQSSMLAAIAMLMVIMLVDTTASARMQTYKQQMMMAEKQQYG